MTAHSKPYPRIEQLLSTFADWLKHRRELNEIRQLDRNEFARIASDLRVSPDDLDELVRQGPHAADELPQLLKTLGIDEGDLASSAPLLLRDMERVLRAMPAQAGVRPRSRRPNGARALSRLLPQCADDRATRQEREGCLKRDEIELKRHRALAL